MPNLYNYTPIAKFAIKKNKMEINYIILAHKNPQQVKRLINQLSSSNCFFYIHIDKSADIDPFIQSLSYMNNVYFLPDKYREFGIWGDIGIVKATINALRLIIKKSNFGYCVLLSGQTYPLKNNDEINKFLKNNYGLNFISTFQIPTVQGWGPKHGMDRLELYKINMSNKRMDFIQIPSLLDLSFYKKVTLQKIKKIIKSNKSLFLKKLFYRRKHPSKIKPFGGSQWWSLPIETVRLIINFIDENPYYLKYHEDTLLPDEIFFQSIIMNLKENTDNIIVTPSITHVNWTRKNVPLPLTFTNTTKDQNELKEQSKTNLFARKFDIETDEKILDWIDKNLI